MISMQSTSSVDWKVDSSSPTNAPEATSAKDEKSEAARDFAALLAASLSAPVAAQNEVQLNAKENFEANATSDVPATSVKVETPFASETPTSTNTSAAATNDVSKSTFAVPAANSQDALEATQPGAAKVLPFSQPLGTDAANPPSIETKTTNLPTLSSATDNDSADNRKGQRVSASVINTMAEAARQTDQSLTGSFIKPLFAKQTGASAQESTDSPARLSSTEQTRADIPPGGAGAGIKASLIQETPNSNADTSGIEPSAALSQSANDADGASLINAKTANALSPLSIAGSDSQTLLLASQTRGVEKTSGDNLADKLKNAMRFEETNNNPPDSRSVKSDSKELPTLQQLQRNLTPVVNTIAEAARQTDQSSTGSLIKSLFVKQAGDSAKDSLAQPFDKNVSGAAPQGSIAFNALPVAANEGGNNSAQASAIVSQTHDSLLMFAEQLARRESRTFRLNLRPIELGGIEVRLARNAQGHVSAQLSVERNATQQALAGNITDLRESLERAGIVVERLDVSLSNNGHTQAGNDHESQREAFASTAAHQPSSSQVSTTEDNVTPVIETENRLLNMRA